MNLQNEIQKIARLKEEAKETIQQLDVASTKTIEFLDKFKTIGITRISIGARHKSIPRTMDWPFSAHGSVFGFFPESTEKKLEWSSSTFWNVIPKEYSGGCGNTMQHSLTSKADIELFDGVYHLKKGKWMKVD